MRWERWEIHMISYKKFSGQKFLREDTVMDHLDYDQEI